MSALSEINASFDLEGQQTLLPEIIHLNDQLDLHPTWRKLLWVFRFLKRFKVLSAQNRNHDIVHSSRSQNSYYSAIDDEDDDDDDDEIQDTAQTVVTTHEISEDHSDEGNISINVHATMSGDEYKKNIAEIVKLKNLENLRGLGGITGVARELKTDLENGITSSTRHVGEITPSTQQPVRVSIFFHCFQKPWNNYTIILLLIAAVLSLVFGIKQQGSVPAGWVDGTIVLFTIFLLVLFKTTRYYFRAMSYHHKKLETYNKLKTRVIRNGNQVVFSAIDLKIGDLVVLKRGCLVPADGLVYLAAGEQLEVEGYSERGNVVNEENPFLFHGSRVISGNAKMLVISVGMDTVWGEIMSQAIMSPEKSCKFEAVLNNVNNFVQTVALFIGILISIALFLRYILGKSDGNGSKTDPKGEGTHVSTIVEAIKEIIISRGSKSGVTNVLTSLSISLIGVMEGIPVVISFAILSWNRKTLEPHKALDRDYMACVKIASITSIICTDKLGGLTEHEQEIETLLLVGEEFFSESSQVASHVLEGICDGIKTMILRENEPIGPPPIDCNSESIKVIVSWAEAMIGMRMTEQCKISKRVSGNNPFRECCRVVMENNIGIDGRNKYLHYIGPPCEILLFCSHYYDLDGEMHRLNDSGIFENVIEQQVIAFACKRITNESEVEANHGLILLGMIGFKYRKSEETKRSILALKEAGIRTILATGDDVSVLKTIGQNCGLLSESSSSDDLLLTAEQYRDWSDAEKKDRIGKISIIGNCLLSDKIDLLKHLKEKGENVAVLAQRTIDAPLLKEANIGLTSGSWTSEVAREIADIHILDGDFFGFLVDVIKKGRCFHVNIGRDFVQIQIIISISSALINFIASVLWGDAPLTTIQLFWLNLTVALVAGLIVMTGPTMLTSSMRSSYDFELLLITKSMWRNIAIQALYQTSVFVTLQSKGQAILGINEANVKSLIYKGFCSCQLFCMIIAREPKARNIFRGVYQKNEMYFCVAMLVFLLLQAVFFVAETFLGGTPWLTWKLLGECLFIGIVSWLLDIS